MWFEIPGLRPETNALCSHRRIKILIRVVTRVVIAAELQCINISISIMFAIGEINGVNAFR